MNTLDFLRRIWSDRGYYLLAKPFAVTGTDQVKYAQVIFETIESAADYAFKQAGNNDVFFCVHTLRTPEAWNPKKKNPKTGEMGAYSPRMQSNMQAARAFFFDLDVGPGESKYADQNEAIAALKSFAIAVGLPRPMVVLSGGGIHAYWPLETALPTEDWKPIAAKLRALASHHGLRVDPTRTTDTSSVLRPVGTYNHKDPANPRPVTLMVDGDPTPTDRFIEIVDAAAAHVPQPVTPASRQPDIQLDLGDNPVELSDLDAEANIDRSGDQTPVPLNDLIGACAQMQRLARLRGNVSEPEWYHSLNLTRFTDRPYEDAHALSDGHPTYTIEETDAKLGQLEAQDLGPTTCTKLADVCGAHHCDGCPFAGHVRSPIVAARRQQKEAEPAPAPTVELPAGDHTETREIPPPPPPYRRTNEGIGVLTETEDGYAYTDIFLDDDLYPVSRIADRGNQTERQWWCAVLPRAGPTHFAVDADALYDRKKLGQTMANSGVFPANAKIGKVQEYMVAYIRELQKHHDVETQFDHLGWTADQSKFILPKGAIHADGSTVPVTISESAKGAADTVHPVGTLEQQVELLKFYDHDAYIINQFMILAALASPMFYATGYHGAILNASGPSGAYKSTTLHTGASLWGNPSSYAVNGTSSGATTLALNQRVSTLANLPVCVDEITNMPTLRAQDMTLGVTQPNERLRLNRSGKEQHVVTDTVKSTLMLCTANSSLHSVLSMDNSAATAGSMRVFEIECKPVAVHTQVQADEFVRRLRENYGHIGPAFMHYYTQNRKMLEDRVHAKMAEINQRAGAKPAERFWVAIVSVVSVVADIANQLGLLPYSSEKLEQWALGHQIPHMRNVVDDEYASPLAILTDFIEQHSSRILVTDKVPGATGGKNVYPVREPRGDMIGHYHRDSEVMAIHRATFKEYCVRIGANAKQVLDDLHNRQNRIVTCANVRRVLGERTDLQKTQSWCFVVNMEHPEVAGATRLATVEGEGGNPAQASAPAQNTRQ